MIHPDLPLIDLHRHLDGNVRLQTIIDLASEHNIELPTFDAQGLRPHVQIMDREEGLMAFIARFRYLTAVMASPDACRRIAYENVEDAAREGLSHVELRFSPWFMAETHDLGAANVVSAVIDGTREAIKEYPISVGLIGILSRTYGAATCDKELDALLTHADDLVAIDLAGDEAGFPAHQFTNHFKRVHEAGLKVTVHAGEADGPMSIWSAIKDLGTHRIGHGIRCLEDPVLVDYLVESGIGLEVNLTSNVHTSTVDSLTTHPMKELLRAGIVCNLNTDDPSISGINLLYEFDHAAIEAGLTEVDLRRIQENALRMAFLSRGEKSALPSYGEMTGVIARIN